ncbi:MAG: hypothetical protein ABIG44_08105 [Planctomycetota bacterium]
MMLRVLLTSLFVVALVSSAAAQDRGLPPWPGQPKPGEPTPLSVKTKLVWLCNQLELTEEQWKHTEGLFAILEVEGKKSPDELQDLLTQIRELSSLIQEADDAGDKERAAELRAELRALAPGVQAQANFLNGLTPQLTDPQIARLDELIKRLEKVQYLEQIQLQPIQVVRIARSLNLSAEQQGRLEQVMSNFRAHVKKLGQIQPVMQTELLDKIIADVGTILTPEQSPSFKSEVQKLRLDAPARG